MSTEDGKPTKAVPVRPARPSFLGSAVAPTAPANNMSAGNDASMTFVMPRNWHREFKATASLHDMTMKDLLIEAFDAWKREQKAKAEMAE